MGIFALSTLLVAGAGIFIFSRIFPNFQPGNKKVQADLELMKEDLQKEADQLVPLEKMDIELLASEEEDRTEKKGFTRRIRGKFSTIFHEPVVLFSYKKYISTSGKDAVLYAKTSDHDYFYWIKEKGIKIVIDQKLIGTMEADSVLYAGKRDRVLARINRQSEDEYLPVFIGDREVGAIGKARAGGSHSLSTRAFGYVRDDIGPEEKILLMALTIYELVSRRLN